MNDSCGKRYFVWAFVENQPNVVEKLVGFLRRSCGRYCINQLYFGPVADAAVFAVEVGCDEKAVTRLVKVYSGYVEVIKVGYKPIEKETVFNEMESIQRLVKG